LINSHFALLVIFSALVSLVFTYIAKYGPRERVKYFLYLFGSFVILSIVVGWLMYPFPF
jgi:hypothetical protein